MARNTTKAATETPVAAVIPANLVWGKDYTVAFADLPAATVFALAQQGFTHKLGNEVAAYASGLKDATNENGTPKHGESEIATMAHDKRLAIIQAALAGTLGVRVGGPRGTKLETIMRAIALETIKRSPAIASGKVAMPKGEKLDSLCASLIAKTPAIREEAERRMAGPAVESDVLDSLLAE